MIGGTAAVMAATAAANAARVAGSEPPIWAVMFLLAAVAVSALALLWLVVDMWRNR